MNASHGLTCMIAATVEKAVEYILAQPDGMFVLSPLIAIVRREYNTDQLFSPVNI